MTGMFLCDEHRYQWSVHACEHIHQAIEVGEACSLHPWFDAHGLTPICVCVSCDRWLRSLESGSARLFDGLEIPLHEPPLELGAAFEVCFSQWTDAHGLPRVMNNYEQAGPLALAELRERSAK